jgi:lipoprotein NlpI
MRTCWLLFSLAVCAVGSWSYGQTVSTLQQIVETARTNLPVALALSDEAVSRGPTNAQPLLLRARLLERARRFDDGIRDLTAALKLRPSSAEILQGRGELNFKAGHFKESVADFDRVIELAPRQAAHHWQRGISLYYANRFADGRKQFELHQTVNPNDVENAAWHFLCAAREVGVTNARAAMLKSGLDARIPMQEIDELYRGTGSVERVLKAAQSAPSASSRNALFYARLYLGLYFDVLGDVSKAREHIGKAAEEFNSDHYMGEVARVHARQLKLK